MQEDVIQNELATWLTCSFHVIFTAPLVGRQELTQPFAESISTLRIKAFQAGWKLANNLLSISNHNMTVFSADPCLMAFNVKTIDTFYLKILQHESHSARCFNLFVAETLNVTAHNQKLCRQKAGNTVCSVCTKQVSSTKRAVRLRPSVCWSPSQRCLHQHKPVQPIGIIGIYSVPIYEKMTQIKSMQWEYKTSAPDSVVW